MQVQQTLDVPKIAIPQDREEVISCLRNLWSQAPTLTHEYCIEITDAVKKKFSGDKKIEGCANLLLMTSAYIRNNFKEVTLLGSETLELFQTIHNTEGEGACYVIMGANYRSIGNNDSALNYIEKGIALISENSDYRRFLALGYYQGAELFFLFNKIEESLKYFNKALNIPDVDVFLKSRTYNGIGNVYLKLGNHVKAKKLLDDAYDLVKDAGNNLLNARLLSDIANFHFEIKEYDLALVYENKSFELRKKLNLKAASITNLLHFYKIYNVIGDSKKAFESLEEAYALAKETDLKGKLAEVYQKRVEYFEDKHQFEEALTELKKYVASHETELNSSFDLKIKGIKAVHEVEFARKEAEITREKNKALSEANEKINSKNQELKLTLDELTRAKISRKSVMVTLVIGISLCLLTEIFVDPLVDNLSYNNYISLAVKAIIAISLKPIDTAYETYMIKKALK